MRRPRLPERVRTIIEEVAAAKGVRSRAVLSDLMLPTICAARHEAMYRIRVTHPEIPVRKIAGWFGKTIASVHYSMAVHSRRTGAPAITGYRAK